MSLDRELQNAEQTRHTGIESPSLGRSMRRGGWAALALVVAAVAFFAHALKSVTGPTQLSVSLQERVTRIRGARIAEDLARRALLRIEELRAGARLILPEGSLSRFPERASWVEMRSTQGRRELVCSLARGQQQLLFRGRSIRGSLLPCMLWPLGQVEESANEQGLIVEALHGRPRGGVLEAVPYREEALWSDVDFVVDPETLERGSTGRHALHLANFRAAEGLALEASSAPTSLPNFELGTPRAARIVTAFRGSHDLVILVRGHLWLGRPGHHTVIETGGRSVVLLVEGNVRIRGNVDVHGERDQVFVVAGRPGTAAFRDLDGDGLRDPGEMRLDPHVPSSLVSPIEGGGLIYLGDAQSRADVCATLVASQDVVVATAGARIRGGILCRRLTRVGPEPGAIVIRERHPLLDLDRIPRRGLPVVPGSAGVDRVEPPLFWRSQARPIPAAEGRGAPTAR